MPGVTWEHGDGVAVITLENEGVRNALTPDIAAQLIAACDEIDARPEIGAAVLRGASGTFCSGADTRTWSADVDWLGAEGEELLGAIYAGFTRVGALTVPSIAAVRGAAVGAGLNLLLACDVRIVADDARLIAGFARVGIHPGGGFFTLAARAAGREAAAAFGLLDADLTGAQAVARGLAWEAVPDADVEPRARELAARAARDPALARRALQTFRAEMGPPAMTWPAALSLERGEQVKSMHRRFEEAARHVS